MILDLAKTLMLKNNGEHGQLQPEIYDVNAAALLIQAPFTLPPVPATLRSNVDAGTVFPDNLANLQHRLSHDDGSLHQDGVHTPTLLAETYTPVSAVSPHSGSDVVSGMENMLQRLLSVNEPQETIRRQQSDLARMEARLNLLESRNTDIWI